mgnify:CR=1 FL=1
MKRFLLALALIVPMVLVGCKNTDKSEREPLSDIATKVLKACTSNPDALQISSIDTIFSTKNDSIAILSLIIRGQNVFGGQSMQTLEMAIYQENDSLEYYYANQCVEQTGSLLDRYSDAFDKLLWHNNLYRRVSRLSVPIDSLIVATIKEMGVTKEYVEKRQACNK